MTERSTDFLSPTNFFQLKTKSYKTFFGWKKGNLLFILEKSDRTKKLIKQAILIFCRKKMAKLRKEHHDKTIERDFF